MVQWLRLPASNAEDMSSFPDQETKIPHVHGMAKNKNEL